MGSSPTLVAPGLRTAARTGWRAGVATAVGVVVDRPSLWLLGALGYLVRGGAVLMTLAIMVLPTPVAVRLMLGDYLGSSGFAPEFFIVVGIGAALLAALALLAMGLLAWVELNAFERFIAAEQAQLSAGRAHREPGRGARRRLLASLFVVQLAGLAAVVACAVPLAVTAFQATYSELLRPTLAGGALYDRVLAQLGEPLFVLLVGVVVVEMVTAVASRRLLVRAFGLTGPAGPDRGRVAVPFGVLSALRAGLMRPIVRPLTTLPTALLGWLAMLTALLPIGWALPLAWEAARARFLDGVSADGLIALLLVAAMLSLVWLAGLLLAGFASAMRAGLWSSEEMR